MDFKGDGRFDHKVGIFSGYSVRMTFNIFQVYQGTTTLDLRR